MSISIITLNYNKPQLTLSCLASLYLLYQKEFEENSMEVIIVDNKSGDGSVDVLTKEIAKKKYKNIHLIENSENAGFGKGCNVGAAKAKGKYLLFLNNDTTVKDREILTMASYMEEHPPVAIMGGQLKNPNGTLQPSTGNFYTLPKVLFLLLGMQRYGLLDKSPRTITEVDWVKGGLLMVRKDIFDTLGGFDENIFMYTEDMELCYRARQAGHHVYFFSDITVLHAEHGSTNKTFAIVNIYKNLVYFYKKHRSWFETSVLLLLLMIKAVILIVIGIVFRKSYLKQTYLTALKGIL